MKETLLFDQYSLKLTLDRLAQQLIEDHRDFKNTVLLGLQPRGVHFGDRIVERLAQEGIQVPYGRLDATFYRDDFRRNEDVLQPNATQVDFLVENKHVVLLDDVFYTGRTVRAAISAMMAFGRPERVDLMVLIDRLYSRHLPIEPRYTGRTTNTIQSQRVRVQWSEAGHEQDAVYLIHNQSEQ